MQNSDTFDIIIVGGGMVGAALACALDNASYHVALIDSAPNTSTDDPRLIALNYGSYCLLKNLAIWPRLAEHATAIQQVHVSHAGHFGKTRFLASDYHISAFGYVVYASKLLALLRQATQQKATIKWLCPAKFPGP